MRTHTLKIEDTYYERIRSGEKTFEVRYNDRDYQKGDRIFFTSVQTPTWMREGQYEITHVHSGLGMNERFVVLAIKEAPLEGHAR